MLYKSVILCVGIGRTPTLNTKNKEELPEKWKESFVVYINWIGYKWFCSD